MKRLPLLLSILAAILIVVLWWFLFLSPQREELEQVEVEIDQVLAEQQQVRSRVAQLRQVRERASEIEAELVRTETLIPSDAALPSMVRQLQLAAEDSQTVIRTISVSRPSGLEGGAEGQAELSAIQITMSVEGNYFRIVDLLRRMDDPLVVGRGLVTDTLSLGMSDYPDLQASISARAFAVIPPAVVPDAVVEDPVDGEPDPTPDDDDDEQPEDADDDLEVEQ